MRERILNDLVTFMKAQEKEKLIVFRMVKGAILMEELNKKRELTDEEVIDVITKQIKTRNESIAEFKKGNRNDLIEKTEREIKILEVYLPEPLTNEEIDEIIEQAFAEVKPSAPQDMGKLMGLITPKVKGKADMGLISKRVKEKLHF